MKNENITWLRAMACMMVLVNHVSTSWLIEGNPLMAKGLFLWQISAPAVPLFVMTSGLLLFNKAEEPSLALAGRRFWKIFKILAYFGTVYYIYDTFQGRGHYFYPSVFLEQNSGHLWYLFSILPIYTLSAYISLPRGKSQNFYGGFFIIVFCLYFLTESLKLPPFNLASQYSLNQLFLHMVMGFILGQLRGGKAWFFFAAHGALMVIYAILYSLLLAPKDIRFGYGSTFLLLQSLTLFMAMLRLNTKKILNKAWAKHGHSTLSLVAKYSLGIYGWHIIFLGFSISFWGSLGLSAPYVFPLVFISTLLGSLLISMADTWFWARVRARLAALWQKISIRLQKT